MGTTLWWTFAEVRKEMQASGAERSRVVPRRPSDRTTGKPNLGVRVQRGVIMG